MKTLSLTFLLLLTIVLVNPLQTIPHVTLQQEQQSEPDKIPTSITNVAQPSEKNTQKESQTTINNLEATTQTGSWIPYKNLTNGLIEQNNLTKEFRAIVTTKPQRQDDLSYYTLEKKDQNTYWIKSVYGTWQLNRSTGVILLNNQNQTIWSSEEWFGIGPNGQKFPSTEENFFLLDKNSDNITLRKQFIYGTNGYLNITYSWVKGALKITTLLYSAKNFSNIRVGMTMLGLGNFTKQDILNYNSTNRWLDFNDMVQYIDNASSSFQNGNLTLITNLFSINAGQNKTLDPTSYQTNDINDFYIDYYNTPAYTNVYTQNTLYVGNQSSTAPTKRAFIGFNLDFINYYSIIQSSFINLTVREIRSATDLSNFSVLGFKEYLLPPTETSNPYPANNLFNDNYITSYNTTIRLGSQGTIALNKKYYWNMTDFTQFWVNNRNVSNIGFQLQQVNDVGLTADSKFIGFYDAQFGSITNSPTLTLTWLNDISSPIIYSNITSWSNNRNLVITSYDQPNMTGSGLNRSSLFYSLNNSIWYSFSSPSWSDNITFPSIITIINFWNETKNTTIRFKISDNQGNIGYSNNYTSQIDYTNPSLIISSFNDQAGPWDNIYINSSNHMFYSNDQVMNNSFSITIDTSDNTSGLALLNTSHIFNLDYNQSYNSASYTMIWFITQGNDNTSLTITVTDQANNSNSTTLYFTSDNVSPTSFSTTSLFSSHSSGTVYLNMTNSTDASSGFAYYALYSNGTNYGNYTSAGINIAYHLPPGINALEVIAYDNVNNQISSTTIYVQNDYTYTEQTRPIITDYYWFVREFSDNAFLLLALIPGLVLVSMFMIAIIHFKRRV